MILEKNDFRSKNSLKNVNFGHIHNIIIQRNGGSDFRPMGLISVSGGLISGTLGLKPDPMDLDIRSRGSEIRKDRNPHTDSTVSSKKVCFCIFDNQESSCLPEILEGSR